MRYLIASSALASALLMPVAHARNENIQPKELTPPAPAVTVTAPEAVAKPVKGVMGPALKRLVISPAGTAPKASGNGLTVSGLPELDGKKFEKAVAPFIGQPISVENLNALTRAVVSYYHKHSGKLVDVMAPAGQDVSGGIVRLVVLEAKLGELSVAGNKYFRDSDILGNFTTKPGDALNSQTMLDDLDWANRNPFRRVDLLYRRGQNAGETDVVLNTNDRYPARVYAGIDDTGTDLTGNTRIFTGFNLGHLFCCEHQLNYQFTASDDLEKMRSHALTSVHPLPWRHLLSLSASHQEVNPDVPAPMKSNGFSFDVGARYIVPLGASLTGSHDVVFGYDFKRNNNNLEFGGTQVFNSAIDVSQFSLGYSAKKDDPMGSTTFGATLTASPGGLTDKNSDAAYAVARTDSSAEYMYALARLDRTTLLPANWSLLSSAQLQLANDRLPGSEQLSVGGNRTVRGYGEGEAAGDNGFTLRNELRAPAMHPLRGFGQKDALTWLGFVDFATVDKNDAIAGETPRNTMLSVGPGFRYQLDDNLSVRGDYGLQLRSSEATASSRTGQRAHFGLTLSY